MKFEEIVRDPRIKETLFTREIFVKNRIPLVFFFDGCRQLNVWDFKNKKEPGMWNPGLDDLIAEDWLFLESLEQLKSVGLEPEKRFLM